MTPVASKNRIIFIDLIRAFAVLNMVQGHTVDVLLGAEFRDINSFIFSIWHTNRGLTAPIFLFTAGTVFTYLYRLQKVPFFENPRLKRGFKRSLLLICLAYLLRYPTPTIVYWGNVTEQQLQIFYTVDVLHLISIGLAIIIILAVLSELITVRWERFRHSDKYVFSIATAAIIIGYWFTEQVNWLDIFHPAIAGYFSRSAGSFFPIFPFLAYLTAGAFLGSYLAAKPDIFRQLKFTLSLFLLGVFLLIISYFGNIIEVNHTGIDRFWDTSPNLVIFRLGIVLIINSIFTFFAARMETIPKILILLGRNTLLIYVVHLMILYGSTWNPGIILLFNQSFNPIETILSAIIMILLMSGMVYLINRFNIKNKALVT